MMTKLTLTSVSPERKPKSKAARLAELFPEIEIALEAGHTHRAIFEDVKKTVGLDLSFGYYENTIHRIRQRFGKAEKRKVAPAPELVKNSARLAIHLPASGGQTIGTPTSKLQEALSGPVDDFFS